MSSTEYPEPNVSEVYHNVVLSTMQQVRAFETTLSQSIKIRRMVRHIVYDLPDDINIPFPYLIRITSLCTNLKSSHSNHIDIHSQCFLIKEKIAWGLLTSLCTITLLNNVAVGYIHADNYHTALSQQLPTLPPSIIFDIHSLRVATYLDLNLVLQNPCIDEIYLVLDKNSSLLDKIGHKLNRFFRIKTMVIANYHDSFEYESSVASTEQIMEPVPCLHIRNLSMEVSEDNSDWWMYRSLMTTFTMLDNLSMVYSKTPPDPSNPTPDARPRLSSDIAIEFLNYVMQIPDHYIESLYLEDLSTVLKEWCKISLRFEILDLTYIWRTEEEEASCLSLWADNRLFKTCIHYASDKPWILPQLGLLKTAEIFKLKVLLIDMGFDPFLFESELNLSTNPLCDFSHILFECREIETIHISHTALSILQPKLISNDIDVELKKLKIAHSLIDASFLSRLSDTVFHLDKLTLEKCKFVGGRNATHHHFIDMPKTDIKEVVFGFNTTEPVKEFFLKIENLDVGSTVFFHYSRSKLIPCSESCFDHPGLVPSLSVSSIHCHRIIFTNPNIKHLYIET